MATYERPTFAEILGVSPLGERARDALRTFRGDPYTPPSRWDVSSLKILKPRLAIETWLGRRVGGRFAPIYNLFNRTRPPVEEGWSVRVTQVRDFRGRGLTYDSHNGTDFAVPPGTLVVAAAPGRVVRVSNEFDRGGLKVVLDHGDGLVTTSNHLSRALVRVGDVVKRGEPVALSGMSGVDGVFAFPWNAPHVHYNVWFDGEPADPFAAEGETSLWRNENAPTPHRPDPSAPDEEVPLSEWDGAGVTEAIEACLDPTLRASLTRVEDLGERAVAVMFQRNYYPTRFRSRPRLYARASERRPRLDLPLSYKDFDGVYFPDA